VWTQKGEKMMHVLTNLISHTFSQSLVLMSFLAVFSFLGTSPALAQNTNQALSQSELNRINNQPLSPIVSPAGVVEGPEIRKPSFVHKEATGTEITEYKDANSPTQVQVKTKYTTYEMSPPDSVKPGPPSGEGSLLSVPSISIPIQ
jgi:hypothetical protein